MNSTTSPLVSALQTAAALLGYKLIPVSREEFQGAKAQDRLNDMEEIRTGKSTPDQIQERNSLVSGETPIVKYCSAFR
jgi:hypothetical protein